MAQAQVGSTDPEMLKRVAALWDNPARYRGFRTAAFSVASGNFHRVVLRGTGLMKTGRTTDILRLRVPAESVALSDRGPRSNGMRKAGKQEWTEDAMARLKPHRNLRWLRLLLFGDQTCPMRATRPAADTS